MRWVCLSNLLECVVLGLVTASNIFCDVEVVKQSKTIDLNEKEKKSFIFGDTTSFWPSINLKCFRYDFEYFVIMNDNFEYDNDVNIAPMSLAR